jgi:hypothetical protein
MIRNVVGRSDEILDKKLKAVIALLRDMTDTGTLVPEQQKVFETALMELRKAGRENNPQRMRDAIEKVCGVLLRAN